jgi:hypothetical protein
MRRGRETGGIKRERAKGNRRREIARERKIYIKGRQPLIGERSCRTGHRERRLMNGLKMRGVSGTIV